MAIQTLPCVCARISSSKTEGQNGPQAEPRYLKGHFFPTTRQLGLCRTQQMDEWRHNLVSSLLPNEKELPHAISVLSTPRSCRVKFREDGSGDIRPPSLRSSGRDIGCTGCVPPFPSSDDFPRWIGYDNPCTWPFPVPVPPHDDRRYSRSPGNAHRARNALSGCTPAVEHSTHDTSEPNG